MENGGRAPWWVHAIATIGTPSVIAIGVVWWMMSTFSNQLLTQQQQVAASQQQTRRIIEMLQVEFLKADADRADAIAILKEAEGVEAESRDAILDYVENGARESRRTGNTLSRTAMLQMQACINAAKSPYQTRKCLELGGGSWERRQDR